VGVFDLKEKIFDKFCKTKPFELRDIAIYLACFFIVIFLFVCLLGFNKDNEISGFKVTVKNQLAITLSFNDGITVEESFSDRVVVSSEDNLYFITIYTENKEGYNQLIFDLSDKSVRVDKSNCSDSKDCVHFHKLTKSGSIYCAPHKLKISTMDKQYKNPTAGEI
jgi:hypothetical protein